MTLNNSQYMRHSLNASESWNEESNLRWIQNEINLGSRIYVIRTDFETAGTFTLRAESKGVLDVSILIYPRFSGQGLATHVLRSISRILSFSTRVHTVQLGFLTGNVSMESAAIRAGYKFLEVRTENQPKDLPITVMIRSSRS